MFTTKSSEHEPLITNKRISLSPTTTNSKQRSYSYKTALCLISILIITASLIYFIFPRNSNTPSSIAPLPSKTYNWVQAEQSHTHSAHVPKSWNEKEECDEDHPFVLALALKQENTELLYEHVAAVSHPKNTDTFHKYWSAEKVRSYFKPSATALLAVTQWLSDNGFDAENGKISMVNDYGNVIHVSLTCGDANRLLNAQYIIYENTKNGNTHLRVKDGVYNIPDTIHEHIDFMSPTIRFPISKHSLQIQTMSAKQIEFVKSHTKDSKKEYKIGVQDDQEADDDDTDETDDSDTTPNIPSRIFDLYDMNDAVADIIDATSSDSLDDSICRQSIASFIQQYYSDSDIELFREKLDVYPESVMERVPITQPQGFGSEAELDTQYISSTGKGIYTYVYYIDSDDIFVSLAEAILATDIPPLVVSISYGADEYELGADWVRRCNEEFGKLALIGTTVLASSGDSGIRGNDDDCLYGTGEYSQQQANHNPNHRNLLKQSGKGTKKRQSSGESYTFIASFPASAPYVTAVGGTEGGIVQDSVTECTGETAWLYSGGGFSEFFEAPEWQTDAINNYFSQESVTFPDEARYTSTGRAYPDISAQSVDYVIAYDSEFYLVSGTSASSPTVAGMISMINYARIKAGKSSLGFLNPSLYELYDSDQSLYFNDVVEGYNIGCECDENIGFYAAEGWDPLSGVGTPKFSQLYDALLDMD